MKKKIMTKRRKANTNRWNEAQKSLNRLLEEIAPFRKRKSQSVQSTEGLWEEASSSNMAENY